MGAAVMHSRVRAAIDPQIDALVSANPNVRILVADNNAFDRSGSNFVRFTERDRSARYDFGLVDRLDSAHLRNPERERYNRFLTRRYTPVYTHEFPLHQWAYRILKAD